MNFPRTQPWLVINSLGAETLVYDSSQKVVHNLNSSVSLVFRYCQEKTSFEEALTNFAFQLELELETAQDLLNVCLEELAEKGLLMDGPLEQNFNRRSFLAKWGVAAALLPLVSSLSLPAAAASTSTCDCSAPPTVNVNVTRSCISGTRTHTFDLSGSMMDVGCDICKYFYDIDNDGMVDFSSATQSSFTVTYSASLTGSIQARFMVQGPCGAGDVSSTVLPAFPVVCP